MSGISQEPIANKETVEITSTTSAKRVLLVDESGVISNTIPAWDYISVAQGATDTTYTFKDGGVGGTTVATIVITFTDATKETISTISRS